MVRLILAAGSMAALCVSVVWFATIVFSSLLIFGESTIQTVLVFGFYAYCVLTLVVPSEHKLFYVLSIPILTQFLHLLQKYDFPPGANSPWRLLPFLIVDLHIVSALIRFKTNLTATQKGVVASWIALNFLSIIISPNLPGIITGAFVLVVITLPLYFCYLRLCSERPSFSTDLERSLCLLFIVLAFGTFGLVFFGAQYKGASNLLITRNISDTNVTMAYFILLWPFALRYAGRSRHTFLLTLLLVLFFAVVVLLSFSRGAVFIVLPYLFSTLLIINNLKQVVWFSSIGILLSAAFKDLLQLINTELAYSWQLRFADFQAAGPALQKLQEASGRAEIRRFAYKLFLESPLYGHGTGSFELLGPGYREAHSMFFTILAEQGLVGMLYLYALFMGLGYCLLKTKVSGRQYRLLPTALCAYLLFVHSVGSVWVIIPAKSLTINCIAPLLLLCMYYYSKSICESSPSFHHG
ncbi:O-antigen ligase family protein [Dyadobacter endophyticus]|uniref:O-antigen ligase family protein n=1 Tax=Dyadobacter endophyticus TaxID=1749036 RepID=UPI003CF1E7ED